MILSKKWTRWIFNDTVKFILFFLVCIYIVFFAIDFSIHGSKILTRSNASFIKLFIYYYNNFVIYLNLFLCLSLIFAIIKVIYSLNMNNELIALQMAGISRYKLSAPIFIIAILLTFTSYINYEYLTPAATHGIEEFKNQHLRTKKKNNKNLVKTIFLDNSTKIIYQKYDKEKKMLFDLFWIKSESDIFHIKYLNPNSSPPIGQYVDHFIKDDMGRLQKIESFASIELSEINFDKTASRSLQPYESRPITTLFAQYKYKRYSSSIEKAYTLSQLNYKLAMPLLPILIVLALIPPCTRFSRSNFIFLISFVSLILFIGFYTLMDGAVILSENRAGSPIWFIWTPILSCFIFFSYKFFSHYIINKYTCQ